MLVAAIVMVGFLASADARELTAIHESQYVRIGGIDQWIQISGANRDNPVLLWLNGGPGASTVSSICLYKSWEPWFTIVMWDQRGEGKTFEQSGDSVATTMNIDTMSSDGIEVAEYLRHRLHKAKVSLLGHSWGSILGIHMIKKRPDLFAVYVGTGQVIRLPRQLEDSYPRLLERAASNPKAHRELLTIGRPPWNDVDSYHVANVWADALDPPSKVDSRVCAEEKSMRVPPYIQAGAQFSGHMLLDAIGREDIAAFAKKFAVPMVFIQGADDLLTTTSVVKRYFEDIEVPQKYFIELAGTGHFAIFRDPDSFLGELLRTVRPLVRANH